MVKKWEPDSDVVKIQHIRTIIVKILVQVDKGGVFESSLQCRSVPYLRFVELANRKAARGPNLKGTLKIIRGKLFWTDGFFEI